MWFGLRSVNYPWRSNAVPLVGGVNASRRRLPDLGSAAAADEKYYPFWIRVKTLNPLRPGEYLYNIGVEYTEGNVS